MKLLSILVLFTTAVAAAALSSSGDEAVLDLEEPPTLRGLKSRNCNGIGPNTCDNRSNCKWIGRRSDGYCVRRNRNRYYHCPDLNRRECNNRSATCKWRNGFCKYRGGTGRSRRNECEESRHCGHGFKCRYRYGRKRCVPRSYLGSRRRRNTCKSNRGCPSGYKCKYGRCERTKKSHSRD